VRGLERLLTLGEDGLREPVAGFIDFVGHAPTELGAVLAPETVAVLRTVVVAHDAVRVVWEDAVAGVLADAEVHEEAEAGEGAGTPMTVGDAAMGFWADVCVVITVIAGEYGRSEGNVGREVL